MRITTLARSPDLAESLPPLPAPPSTKRVNCAKGESLGGRKEGGRGDGDGGVGGLVIYILQLSDTHLILNSSKPIKGH